MNVNILSMEPGKEEEEEEVVFSESEDPFSEREEEEEEEKEEEEEEEEDAKDAIIFSAWMQRYRGGGGRRKTGEEEEEGGAGGGGAGGAGAGGGGRPGSRGGLEPPGRLRAERRASLPCPATLFAMHVSRLHSSSRAGGTARDQLKTPSSRLLLPVQVEVATPAAPPPTERRPSLMAAAPYAIDTERRGQFRRRNVMSLSDAYSVCLICHNELRRGSGTRELQCKHTYHQECLEEWLWRKPSCPTCHVQVSEPRSVSWSSARVKVP